MKFLDIGLSSLSEASTESLEPSMKNLNQSRKRWVLPDVDDAEENDIPFSDDTPGLLGENEEWLIPVNNSCKSNEFSDHVPLGENPISGAAVSGTGLTSSDIHHIVQKFSEGMQDFPPSAKPTLFYDLDNGLSPQSLSSLLRTILGDKLPEEILSVVDFILKTVMREFERLMVKQGEQVIKLKNSLKEQHAREKRLISRAKILETLAAGAGEEVKLVSVQLQKIEAEKKKVEEEMMAREKKLMTLMKERENRQIVIEGLKNELDMANHMSQEYELQLELAKQGLEAEFQAKVKKMELLLVDSNKKVQELESMLSFQIERMAEKDVLYHNYIGSQLQSFQDLKIASVVTKKELLNMQRYWQKEIGAFEVELQGLAKAATGYHKVLAENRLLYNEVQDLKGNIRVYCRVRPFLPGQVGMQGSVDFIGDNGDISIVKPNRQGKNEFKMFKFNKVFGASATQEEVFTDTQPLIRSVLDGYNVCIFAYGQTGSGKTFTMSGPNISSERVWGVNYRALNDLFLISQSRKAAFKYEVVAQMIEIYNEQVRDLLANENTGKMLRIRNNSQLNGLNVPDASMFSVNSIEDVIELMKIGQKHRAVGATALNERSSRSHSVLTVYVQGLELSSGSLLHGCLHLVDLAGSERMDISEATGDRLREAQHINKSLSALGDVISSLAQKSAHIPYCSSKLTQLLQDSLGGQAKALMFVHISPDIESYGETISTLKFAERVASVELGAARSHKESKEVHDLKEQIASLKDLVAKKDADIECIQSINDSRINSSHNIMGFEKLKAKDLNASSPNLKAGNDMQQQSGRKHFSDGLGSIELNPLEGQSTSYALSGWAQKRSSSPFFHDTFLQESDPVSPVSSPRETEILLGKEEDKLFKALHCNGSTHNKAKGNAIRTLVNVQRNAPHDVVMEQEALSKDWRDRMRGSTDSSFPETASLSELSFSWDSGHTGNADVHPLAPYKPPASSSVRRVLDRGKSGKFPNSQEPLLTWSEELLNHRDRDSKQSTGHAVNTIHEIHFQTDAIELKVGDMEDMDSDLSDGELSQTESLLSSTERTRCKEYNSGKIKRGERRRISQVQFPHLPPRNERRPLHRGRSHSGMRRHTNTVPSTVVGTECSLSKRKSSAESKNPLKSGMFCGCYSPMTK